MERQEMIEILRKVRETNPLIHNITNVVVTNFTANGLLALGASPVMANAPEEAADMAKIASSLVLNIGTLTNETVEAMLLAGKSANVEGVPVIFDPVGVGATPFRTQTARRILEEVTVSIVRGNAAEIANLIGGNWEIKGVDAGSGEGDLISLAKMAARKLNHVVVITGKEDVVSDGVCTYVVENGHPLQTRVTGVGCLLTSVIGAFAAVEEDLIKASVAALTFYGVAAEKAAALTAGRGPGSFQIEFLNQLSLVGAEELEQMAAYKKEGGI